jgi:hypothetical protein
LPRLGALALRRVREPAKRSSVSVMVWSSPWVLSCGRRRWMDRDGGWGRAAIWIALTAV